jgi:hypothetical protein
MDFVSNALLVEAQMLIEKDITLTCFYNVKPMFGLSKELSKVKPN